MDAVKRINTLFPKYLDRQITETEWEELLVWMSTLNEEELTTLSDSQKYLWEKAKAGELPSTADKVNWDTVWENIIVSQDVPVTPVAHRIHFLKTTWFRYAAAVVLLIGGSILGYTILHNGHNDQTVANADNSNKQLQTDIPPGSNKAVLTIGNQSVNLSDDKTGIAVGNAITYNDGSSVDGLSASEQRLTVNVLSTPRGGQYQATLPDGSKVWLNAASSIKFPSKFTGDKREVEVNGEVYLEVAKNSKQPFFVHTKNTMVQVLGTSFNLNAYTDEEVEKTTLIEGSIKVSSVLPVGKDKQEVILKPSQQAILTNDLQLTTHDAETASIISWVKGFFYFDKANVKAILRQVSRWYDVEIIYEGQVPEDLFSGKMERNIPLSGMLRFLEQNGVKVRQEGKKLFVQ